MLKTVKIHSGYHQLLGVRTDVSGREFGLLQAARQDAHGFYLQVQSRGYQDLPEGNIRVRVAGEDQYTVSASGPAVEVEPESTESDEEIIERLRIRFDMLEDMTRAVKRGAVRAMIVSGPPGVGKSHGVERVLDRYDLVEQLGGARKYEIVKGAMSAIGLYVKLYKYSARDNVIVFDDCDSIFADELSLNILKAALDSKKRRMIHWNTDSFKLRNEGVPDQFCFEGSAIFITNLRFDRARGKIRDHLAALESRCHYMDLTIHTEREKMLRIRQIVTDGMLAEYGFSAETTESIVQFVDRNRSRLRELSLRTVVKIADLVKAFPDRWPEYAENTVMR